jgi:hypothetical protein
MAAKSTKAKMGLGAAKAAPAKGKLAKGGLKLGRRKAKRTPAGTVVLYSKALVGNADARSELQEAYASARKAYRRSSDKRGRPDLAALLQDRKASKEAGNALDSLRQALRIADRKREKPRSVGKAPVIAVVTVAGAGTAVALNEGLRKKVMAPLSGGDSGQTEPTPQANGAAAA